MLKQYFDVFSQIRIKYIFISAIFRKYISAPCELIFKFLFNIFLQFFINTYPPSDNLSPIFCLVCRCRCCIIVIIRWGCDLGGRWAPIVPAPLPPSIPLARTFTRVQLSLLGRRGCLHRRRRGRKSPRGENFLQKHLHRGPPLESEATRGSFRPLGKTFVKSGKI